MNSPKISVIVPVFNTEKYISECIDSILAQTFTDWELILVDDGSKDNSGKICDEYATKDSRVRVLHQPNGGVTSARSNGVKNAKGEWITFVDADDTLPVDALKMMIEKVDDNTDIVVGRYDDRKLPKTISIRDYRSACISGTIFSTALWAKLYRRNLFNNWVFDIPREIKVGEDLLTNVRLSFMTQFPPVITQNIVYNYRSNPQSVMHTYIYTVDKAERRLIHLKKSIPEKDIEQYRYDYNLNVFRLLSRIVSDNPNDTSWKSSSLYEHLCKEIKGNRFSMTLSQRMALWPRSKFQMRIISKLLSLFS